MACQIKELAEYILANYDEKSNVWKQVNSVLNIEKSRVEIPLSTINIKGYEIKFRTVPKGSIKNIASTNSRTQEIKLQEGITAVDVAEYLRSENTPETRLKVLKILKNKYEVDFNALLRNMQNSPQLLRKFLLLHEYRYLQQILKRDSAEKFNAEYKKDPVKFELDADLFALRTLREEIEIIAPYTDLTLQVYKEVPAVEEKKADKPEFTQLDLSWTISRLSDGLDTEAIEFLGKNPDLAVIELNKAIAEYTKYMEEAKEDKDTATVREYKKSIRNVNKAIEKIKETAVYNSNMQYIKNALPNVELSAEMKEKVAKITDNRVLDAAIIDSIKCKKG